VRLDDGSALLYDVLVLAPGLHNATLSAVKAGGVGGVCSAAELAAHLTAADAADLAGVIVYGDTLDAVTAMATLAAQGVDLADAVLHVAPPGSPGPGLDVLLEVRLSARICTPHAAGGAPAPPLRITAYHMHSACLPACLCSATTRGELSCTLALRQ
jgi:hypothetical protein